MLPDVLAGRRDIERAAEALATRLPEPLGVFARIAYNYRWAWDPDGPETFAAIDPDRWEKVAENPVKLLQEAATDRLAAAAQRRRPARPRRGAGGAHQRRPRAPAARRGHHPRASDRVLLRRVRLPRLVPDLLGRPRRARRRHPQGGLRPRVAAGRGRPAVPQRLLPPAHRRRRLAARVLGRHRPGPPARRARHRRRRRSRSRSRSRSATTRSRRRSGASTSAASRSTCSTPSARRTTRPRSWITSRLYIGDEDTRLAQYMLLGIGGVRALEAMGIEPGLVHLNEGHAAFVSLELARRKYSGQRLAVAPRWRSPASSTIFTTHTPGPGRQRHLPRAAGGGHAGADRRARSASTTDEIISLGRTNPDEGAEPFGVTQFALRTSRAANGVSRRHGEVAREMWQRDVAREGRRRRPDHLRDQRRAHPDLARPADVGAAEQAPRRGLAGPRDRPRDLGAGRRHPGQGAVGRPPRAARPADRVRAPPRRRRPARARRAAPVRRGRGERSIPTC